MEKNTLITIALGVLILVALVQFFQISTLANGAPTGLATADTNTPVKQVPQYQAPSLQKQQEKVQTESAHPGCY